jgi:hypothetical protein
MQIMRTSTADDDRGVYIYILELMTSEVSFYCARRLFAVFRCYI